MSALKQFWEWTSHDPVAFYTFVLSIFNGLLFTITVGLVWMAFRQERMARVHERAYIFGGGPFRIADANRVLQNPDEGWITIENYGRTPAFIKTLEWGFCDESLFPRD